MRGILEEIGQAGELLAYHSARAGGKLVLVDGHLRSTEFSGEEWDVAITDLTDEEADKLLVAHDLLDFGAIIGKVNVVDCVPVSEVAGQPFAEGPWCWILEGAESIEPVPYNGRQGLFVVKGIVTRPFQSAP